MHLIDTHCHLDDPKLQPQLDTILNKTEWLEAVVLPSIGPNNWQAVKALGERSQKVWPAFGMHPYFIEEFEPYAFQKLEQFIDQQDRDSFVAVGEIGLDLYTEPHKSSFEEQYKLFKQQLKLAKQIKKPVILHIRKAEDFVFKALRETQFDQGGFAHAYGGSVQQAQKLIDFGFKIGVGGSVTYDRATKLISNLQKIGMENWVMETDAPYIPPSFDRESPNSPLKIRKIAEIFVDKLGLDLVDIALKTTRNARNVLNL